MDNHDEYEPAIKIKSRNKKSSLQIEKSTLKKVRQILTKLNKGKQFGRAVSPDDLITKSLSRLQENDFVELKEATFSNEDRFKILFKKLRKENPKLTQEEFYGQVISQSFDDF